MDQELYKWSRENLKNLMGELDYSRYNWKEFQYALFKITYLIPADRKEDERVGLVPLHNPGWSEERIKEFLATVVPWEDQNDEYYQRWIKDSWNSYLLVMPINHYQNHFWKFDNTFWENGGWFQTTVEVVRFSADFYPYWDIKEQSIEEYIEKVLNPTRIRIENKLFDAGLNFRRSQSVTLKLKNLELKTKQN